MNDGAYVINIDEYSDIVTHQISVYALDNNVTYFDSFGNEHIPKEIKTFVDKSTVVTNIFRMQAYDSVMCVCYCIRLLGFMLESKA